MRIGYYSHNIDFAGTWRSHERIAQSLQHVPGLSIDVFYSPRVDNNRLDICRTVLSKCNFIPFERSLEKTGPELGYTPVSTNIGRVVKERAIDVFHFARSGYHEWPFNQRMAPVQIETNIFGYVDNSPFLDGTIYIANCLGIRPSKNRVLIPNPITPPSTRYSELKSLRRDLGISDTALVFGRIGRPANFTPISLDAFSVFRKSRESKYIIVGGCDEAKSHAQRTGVESDVIFLDCTNDDEYIERFHKTIDIFAHYRSDGEICSTAISQAMLYGIPVITHHAGKNGQAEWLGGGGACVSTQHDYLHAMHTMAQDDMRSSVGQSARNFAELHFDQEKVANQILDFYTQIKREKS